MAKSRQKGRQKYRHRPLDEPASEETEEYDDPVDDRADDRADDSRFDPGYDLLDDPADAGAGERAGDGADDIDDPDDPDDIEHTATLAAVPAAPMTVVSARDDARPRSAPAGVRTRTAHLRVVHVDPWSVMKTSFVLSIALGITAVVAVTVIWGVLGVAGVWDAINDLVGQVADSPNDPTPFDITNYLGTSRVLGFTLIAAVVDVVLVTAIATLGAFVYNLAATLVGGVEMTFAEER